MKMKTIVYWHKNGHMNGTKDPETNSYTATVIWFLTKNCQNQTMDSTFQQNVLGKFGNYVQGNETRPLSLSMHK